MSPAFLDQMSWAMAEVYGSVTDRLLTNIARHFKYAQGPQDLMGSFEYQVRKLAELGQVNRENVDIIVDSLDGADGALRMSLELAIKDALKTVDPTLRKAAERGLLQGAGTTPPEVSPSQMQAFKAYYAQSADKLNLVNTVMLESSEDAYRATLSDVVSRIQRSQSILNTGAGEVVTGVSSWNQAMHDAVSQMVKNGLTGFIDHAGRHWSPEAYVAMDIRTTMFNTARAAVWERAEDYGSDIYQVSTHNGARPKCYPWQGKLISRIDNSRDVPDLDGNMVHVYAQSETSYGAADGLFGVNCKHYPTPFIPGFSTLRGEPQSPEENEKTYEESQQQRALERKVRDEKLKLSIMEAQGADEEAIKAQRAKVRAASADVQAFCDETGRTRRKSREYTPVHAKFPPEDSYDPATFRTEQRDAIRQWAQGSRGVQATQTAQSQIVAPQATITTPSRDIFNNVKGLNDQFKKGMADTLNKSTSTAAKAVYTKYADELVCVNNRKKNGAWFNAGAGGVSMNMVNVANGSNYETPYEVAFHEFGHMIDWLAGGKNNQTYLSNTPFNGKQLLDVIKTDYQVFKASINAATDADVIAALKAENMDLKTCGNISDILEKCTGKSYPLGIGHGTAYHRRPGATEKEFFAEVLDSRVANDASYNQMVRLFPNAVDLVWDMIRSVI